MKSGIAMAHRHLEADHPDPDFPVIFGYTSDRTLGESFMQITAETYGMDNVRLCQVSGIIGTHLARTPSVWLMSKKHNAIFKLLSIWKEAFSFHKRYRLPLSPPASRKQLDLSSFLA